MVAFTSRGDFEIMTCATHYTLVLSGPNIYFFQLNPAALLTTTSSCSLFDVNMNQLLVGIIDLTLIFVCGRLILSCTK